MLLWRFCVKAYRAVPDSTSVAYGAFPYLDLTSVGYSKELYDTRLSENARLLNPACTKDGGSAPREVSRTSPWKKQIKALPKPKPAAY
jgi:hypothetical protein